MDEKKGENEKIESKITENTPNIDGDNVADISPEELKKKQNKQVMWAIILMAAMIIIILSVPYFVSNYINKFDYRGLEFTKTKIGRIDLYTSSIPVATSSGSITGKNILSEYSFYVRNDPRKLDFVGVELDINNITFLKNKQVYVSYNTSDPRCEYNIVSAAELGTYLVNFGNLNVTGSFVNEEYANASKVPYVTCENHPYNTVILITYGNENKISKIKENCYELQYKKCDILPVIERFILAMTEGYLNSVYSDKGG